MAEMQTAYGHQVAAALGAHPWAAKLTVLDTVDSTNTRLKQMAAAGAPEGTAVLADCQLQGRGRRGREFASPKGVGIYLSVLLRPKAPPRQLMCLTALTAVAAGRAIRDCTGVQPGIKWVNDLVLNRRKVCGILTELSVSRESGLADYAVVGIGVNCCQRREDFPASLRQMAGSVASETGRPVCRSALAAALIRQLADLRRVLLTGERSRWLDEYRQNCVTLGQAVQLVGQGEPRAATALDIDENAALVVRRDDGSLETVNAGEVSVRGYYGYI